MPAKWCTNEFNAKENFSSSSCISLHDLHDFVEHSIEIIIVSIREERTDEKYKYSHQNPSFILQQVQFHIVTIQVQVRVQFQSSSSKVQVKSPSLSSKL